MLPRPRAFEPPTLGPECGHLAETLKQAQNAPLASPQTLLGTRPGTAACRGCGSYEARPGSPRACRGLREGLGWGATTVGSSGAAGLRAGGSRRRPRKTRGVTVIVRPLTRGSQVLLTPGKASGSWESDKETGEITTEIVIKYLGVSSVVCRFLQLDSPRSFKGGACLPFLSVCQELWKWHSSQEVPEKPFFLFPKPMTIRLRGWSLW